MDRNWELYEDYEGIMKWEVHGNEVELDYMVWDLGCHLKWATCVCVCVCVFWRGGAAVRLSGWISAVSNSLQSPLHTLGLPKTNPLPHVGLCIVCRVEARTARCKMDGTQEQGLRLKELFVRRWL